MLILIKFTVDVTNSYKEVCHMYESNPQVRGIPTKCLLNLSVKRGNIVLLTFLILRAKIFYAIQMISNRFFKNGFHTPQFYFKHFDEISVRWWLSFLSLALVKTQFHFRSEKQLMIHYFRGFRKQYSRALRITWFMFGLVLRKYIALLQN